MSAVLEVLHLAFKSGVHVEAKGTDLVLEAAVPPPTVVLDGLRHHKAEIVVLLASPRDKWTVVDWQRRSLAVAALANMGVCIASEIAERSATT